MENFGIGGSVADDNWIRVCNFSRDTLNNSGGSLRQERVWVCEACHSALAAFFCKADAASLCTNCDAEIHSANSLASRHRRVPIFAAPAARPASEFSGVDIESTVTGSQPVDDFAEEDEAASWLLFNPIKIHAKIENSVPLYNPEEANDYLGSMDFQLFNEKYDQQHHHEFDVPRPKSLESDGLVPVHTTTRGNSLQLGLNYEPSTKVYKSNYPLSQSTVSASPTDVGIVPDSGMCTASISDLGTPRETIDLVSGRDRLIPTPAQFNSADREARVLRYREKKKARKFEKTIRYASRKAYAEIRPRIKGRFVKRSVVEIENDTSSALHPDNGYGIVPSL